jgi:ubiquinone biosynthesis protein COQ9
VEATILRNTLKHIPSHGFTNTTLALGAKDAGYIDASTNLFPRGPVSVVEYYLWERRTGLKERVEELRRDGMWEGEEGERGLRDRVRMLTWERLMRNKEVVHRWQEVCSFSFNLISK